MCNYLPPESCVPRMACPPTYLSCFKLDRQGDERMPTSLWMPKNWPDRAPEYIKIATEDQPIMTMCGSLTCRCVQMRRLV
jgi:hypothetical protein